MIVVKLYTQEDSQHKELQKFETGVDTGILVKFQIHDKENVDCEIISSDVAGTYEELAEVFQGLAHALDKGEPVE